MRLEDLERLDYEEIQLDKEDEEEKERVKSEMIEALISNYKKYRGV